MRAKLLAQRRSVGNTPTPESVPNKPENLKGGEPRNEENKNNRLGAKPTRVLDDDGTMSGHGLVDRTNINHTGTERENIEKRDSEADIEGLFAEARAAAEAEQTTRHKGIKNNDKVDNDLSVSTKRHADANDGAPRRPSINGSVNSLEASEQGEIRDNNQKSTSSRFTNGILPTAKSDASSGQLEREKANQPAVTKGNSPQRKSSSGAASNITSGESSTLEASQTGRESTSNRKASTGHAHPTVKKAHSKEERPAFAERHYRPAKEITVSQYDNERERERKAAEYKRELEARRQRESAVRHVAPNEPEGVRPSRVNAPCTSEAPVTPHHVKGPEPAPQDMDEEAQELDDWLQMTGYHDRAYRKKALERHRKLIALEVQRAELEREAQLEYEERAQIARAQSVLPHESIERDSLRVAASPNKMRTSSLLAMPPPAVPFKQERDTAGLRIKDLATKELASSGQTGRDNGRPMKHMAVRSPAHPVSLKRQHVPDDPDLQYVRPAEKLVRLDGTGRAMSRSENEHQGYPVRATSKYLGGRTKREDDDDRAEHAYMKMDIDSYNSANYVRRGSPVREDIADQLIHFDEPTSRTSGYGMYVTNRRGSDGSNIDLVDHSPNDMAPHGGSPMSRRYNGDRVMPHMYTSNGYHDSLPERKTYQDQLREEVYGGSAAYNPHPIRADDHRREVSNGTRERERDRAAYYDNHSGYKTHQSRAEAAGSKGLDLRSGGQHQF